MFYIVYVAWLMLHQYLTNFSWSCALLFHHLFVCLF